MFFTGTFQRALDDKQRLAIPKPFREVLGARETAHVYIAPGTDGSLAVYPETAFAALAEQVAQRSPTGEDVRAFSRLFFAQAQRVDIDRQGRMRLPLTLATLARLQREIVLVGVRDHWEIWNQENWEKYVSERQPHYDEIAEAAFGCQASAAEPGTRRQEPSLRPVQPR